jgi:nitrate reductase NapAB chaperone NapD
MEDQMLETRVTWGVVLRINLDDIAEVKKSLLQIPSCKVIYQVVSGNKLMIVPEKGGNQHE